MEVEKGMYRSKWLENVWDYLENNTIANVRRKAAKES